MSRLTKILKPLTSLLTAVLISQSVAPAHAANWVYSQFAVSGQGQFGGVIYELLEGSEPVNPIVDDARMAFTANAFDQFGRVFIESSDPEIVVPSSHIEAYPLSIDPDSCSYFVDGSVTELGDDPIPQSLTSLTVECLETEFEVTEGDQIDLKVRVHFEGSTIEWTLFAEDAVYNDPNNTVHTSEIRALIGGNLGSDEESDYRIFPGATRAEDVVVSFGDPEDPAIGYSSSAEALFTQKETETGFSIESDFREGYLNSFYGDQDFYIANKDKVEINSDGFQEVLSVKVGLVDYLPGYMMQAINVAADMMSAGGSCPPLVENFDTGFVDQCNPGANAPDDLEYIHEDLERLTSLNYSADIAYENSNIQNLTSIGDFIYFSAYDQQGANQVFRYSIITRETTQITSLTEGLFPESFKNANGKLVFSVWDGDAETSSLVIFDPEGEVPSQDDAWLLSEELGSMAVLETLDIDGGITPEYFVYDNKEFLIATGYGDYSPVLKTIELDSMEVSLLDTSPSFPSSLAVTTFRGESWLFFAAEDQNGLEPWRCNLTGILNPNLSGSCEEIADLAEGSGVYGPNNSNPSSFVRMNEYVWFIANDHPCRFELTPEEWFCDIDTDIVGNPNSSTIDPYWDEHWQATDDGLFVSSSWGDIFFDQADIGLEYGSFIRNQRVSGDYLIAVVGKQFGNDELWVANTSKPGFRFKKVMSLPRGGKTPPPLAVNGVLYLGLAQPFPILGGVGPQLYALELPDDDSFDTLIRGQNEFRGMKLTDWHSGDWGAGFFYNQTSQHYGSITSFGSLFVSENGWDTSEELQLDPNADCAFRVDGSSVTRRSSFVGDQIAITCDLGVIEFYESEVRFVLERTMQGSFVRFKVFAELVSGVAPELQFQVRSVIRGFGTSELLTDSEMLTGHGDPDGVDGPEYNSLALKINDGAAAVVLRSTEPMALMSSLYDEFVDGNVDLWVQTDNYYAIPNNELDAYFTIELAVIDYLPGLEEAAFDMAAEAAVSNVRFGTCFQTVTSEQWSIDDQCTSPRSAVRQFPLPSNVYQVLNPSDVENFSVKDVVTIDNEIYFTARNQQGLLAVYKIGANGERELALDLSLGYPYEARRVDYVYTYGGLIFLVVDFNKYGYRLVVYNPSNSEVSDTQLPIAETGIAEVFTFNEDYPGSEISAMAGIGDKVYFFADDGYSSSLYSYSIGQMQLSQVKHDATELGNLDDSLIAIGQKLYFSMLDDSEEMVLYSLDTDIGWDDGLTGLLDSCSGGGALQFASDFFNFSGELFYVARCDGSPSRLMRVTADGQLAIDGSESLDFRNPFVFGGNLYFQSSRSDKDDNSDNWLFELDLEDNSVSPVAFEDESTDATARQYFVSGDNVLAALTTPYDEELGLVDLSDGSFSVLDMNTETEYFTSNPFGFVNSQDVAYFLATSRTEGLDGPGTQIFAYTTEPFDWAAMHGGIPDSEPENESPTPSSNNASPSIGAVVIPPPLDKSPKVEVKTQILPLNKTSTISASQKRWVQQLLKELPSGTSKFICTYIVNDSLTQGQWMKMRKQAKSICDYAKSLDPKLSYWFQAKPTNSKFAGRAMVTSK